MIMPSRLLRVVIDRISTSIGTTLHRVRQQRLETIAAGIQTKAAGNADGDQTSSSDYQFDVFLSYSRKDEEFAKKLEDALESYRLPKEVKTRLASSNRLRVFRDKRDLVPIDGDYWKTIESYLERSANLIIICSPNARQSEYVNHEINTFLRFHEPKRLIPVLLWGRPNNDSLGGPEEHAFPDALCGALTMPLAVEYTEFLRARGRINRGRYHDSWYTLLAKIFGAERAEIEQQDARRQSRSRRIIAAGSAAIITVLSVALVVAVLSRQEVVLQRDQARRLLYASDVNLAQRAFELGNIGMGRKLLTSHLRAGRSRQEDLRGFEWYYLWRLYNGQLASFDETTDIAFSRDGAVFATVKADTLRIWDAASLRETASFRLVGLQSDAEGSDADSHSYSSLDFSPNGQTLAYGSSESTMLLDINSGTWRRLPVPGKGEGRGASPGQEKSAGGGNWDMAKGGIPRFSPNGKLLAVSYGCGLVAVYEAQSLRLITRLGDGPAASGCANLLTFSPDGRILAYGNLYNVKLWDTRTQLDLGEPAMDASLPDGVDQVESITFSPDGRLLAIGDRSKQVVLWRIATRKVLARLKAHKGWVTALAFSPDGRVLYSGGDDQTVKLWDFSSYRKDDRISEERIKVFATLKGHTGSIQSILCSPTGRVTATIGADRTIQLWDEDAGRDFEVVRNVLEVSSGASVIATSNDDATEPTTTLFSLRNSKPAKLWTLKESEIIVLSPDGRTLATSTSDSGNPGLSTIKLWDVSSRRVLTSIRAQTYKRSPIFSPNGRLFTAIGPDGRSVILWDTVTRKDLMPIRNNVELQDYLVSSDGKAVVTQDMDMLRLKLWRADMHPPSTVVTMRAKRQDVSKQNEVEEPPAMLALSPDGRLLALSDRKKVELWTTGSTQKPIPLGSHEKEVSALTFSPDGRLVATGDDAGVVKLWNADTHALLATFKGHKDTVTALAFSPDGRELASGGGPGDGAVKIYGIASMRELLTLTHDPSPASETHAEQGGEDAVMKILFSTQGRSLFTLSGNRLLRIWRGANDEHIAAMRW